MPLNSALKILPIPYLPELWVYLLDNQRRFLL